MFTVSRDADALPQKVNSSTYGKIRFLLGKAK